MSQDKGLLVTGPHNRRPASLNSEALGDSVDGEEAVGQISCQDIWPHAYFWLGVLMMPGQECWKPPVCLPRTEPTENRWLDRRL